MKPIEISFWDELSKNNNWETYWLNSKMPHFPSKCDFAASSNICRRLSRLVLFTFLKASKNLI